YSFSSFPEAPPRDFNDLRHSKDQNVPTAVERRVMVQDNSLIDGAFSMMTMDILNNVLSRADNPGKLGTYLTEEVREITGAKCVIFFKCFNSSDSFVHEIMGISPERNRPVAESSDMERLLPLIHNTTETKLWLPEEQSEAMLILDQMQFGLSLTIPLNVGKVRMGALLALGLPDQIHIKQVMDLMDTLSTIVALVLRNAILFEQQEAVIRERTRELQNSNADLKRELAERKRVEVELKESKALIEAVVENVPLMIFLKEATALRFVILNRAGEELLGYDRRDLIGKNNLDLFPLEQAVHFMAKDREVLDGELGFLDIPEEPILTAKKGQRHLHTRKVCIRGSDGTTKFLLGISEDITDRKRSEEKLQDTLESLRKSFATIIQVMVAAVESRDPYTAGHQIRSADLARAIATEMGLHQDKIEGLRMAGSIHDIGKLSIPAEILSKPTKLTNLEFSLIKEHSRKGYEMLKDVESPWPLAEIVHQHHERMDGSGYPRNLKGDEILIEARILSVSDVVEAMASHRPYRPSLGIDEALGEIEKNRGIFYDDAVVDACLRLFREKGFKLEGI
ncbi:MAG: response regulator receiver, partial [Syntrophaceae bacterium]